MKLPTASAFDLAARCAHPWTSGIVWSKPDDPTVFAFGNAVHTCAEHAIDRAAVDVVQVGRDYSLGKDDTRRLGATARNALDWIAARADEGWLMLAEVGAAFNTRTGRVRLIDRHAHRTSNQAREHELLGIIDLVCVRHGEVMVADWKTGTWQRDAAPGLQVRFAAMCMARMVGADAASGRLLYVDERGVREVSEQLESWDLDETASVLTRVYAATSGGPTPPVPGDWCKRCNILGKCSATALAMREVESVASSIQTADDAARVWAMLPALEQAIKLARDRIKDMAGREPIQLGNGKRLLVQERSRETVGALTPEAVAYLQRNDLQDALEFSTSAAAIRRVGGAKKEREATQALREMGCVRESAYTTLAEVKP